MKTWKKLTSSLYIRTFLLPIGIVFIILLSILEWIMESAMLITKSVFDGIADTYSQVYDVCSGIVFEWKRKIVSK